MVSCWSSKIFKRHTVNIWTPGEVTGRLIKFTFVHCLRLWLRFLIIYFQILAVLCHSLLHSLFGAPWWLFEALVLISVVLIVIILIFLNLIIIHIISLIQLRVAAISVRVHFFK